MRAHSLLLLTLVASLSAAGPDWPHYGGGPEQTRYSPLTQITPANVGSLKVAWTYDTGDAFKGSEMQCQPVVAHGVLYATSPKLRVFALDAATGAPLKWSFDTSQDAKTPSRTRIRGLMYWERGDERRIYFAARHWLYALDAKTGKPLPQFGQDGRIDLREGFDGRDPRTLSVGVNTPGVFYRDLLILGSIVPEGLPSAPGDIRAFDVHTGRQKWAFHTIPHPGELGYDTWPQDAWKYSGGANAWSGVSLDEARGLVYASTGSASYDFYGAQPPRRQPVREHDPLPARRHRRARLALPGHQARCLGSRFPRIAVARSRSATTAGSATSSRKRPRTDDCTSSIATPASRSFRWSRSRRRPPTIARRKAVADAGAADAAAALHPPAVHRGPHHQAHARTREQAVREEWLTLRKGGEFDPPSPRARSSSRAWTAAASGAASPSIRSPASSTSMRTRWRGR